MRITIRRFTEICYCTLLTVFVITLSGCNTVNGQPWGQLNQQHTENLKRERLAALAAREDALAVRETAITNREAELADLSAKLLEEKKVLNVKATELVNKKKNIKSTNKQTSSNNTGKKNTATVLGSLEKVHLQPPGIELDARIDTGATTSSLNAIDIVKFERDGKPYVKFNIINPETNRKIELTRRIRGHVRIKEHDSDSKRRPIINMRVKLADIDEQIRFTLVDRSNFKKQVLLGRNFLRDLAVVDVSKEYVAPRIRNTDSNTK